MFLKKIVRKAAGAGRLCLRACGKLKKRTGLHRVKDRGAVEKVEQYAAYAYLQKKYKKILMSEVTPEGQPKNSRIIWLCWFSGFETAPALVRSCCRAMQERLPGYQIVLLTDENIGQYVQLPDYIEEKRKKGIIPPAHYSDLVRTALICRHGGFWMDATVLCTDPAFVDYIMEQPLFVFKEVLLYKTDAQPTVASSWLIGGLSNQPILLLTQKLLYAYWQKEKKLRHYFLFHLFFAMATARFDKDWKQVPTFNNISPHILQFEMTEPFDRARWEQIKSFSAIHKLNHHIPYDSKADTYYTRLINGELR